MNRGPEALTRILPDFIISFMLCLSLILIKNTLLKIIIERILPENHSKLKKAQNSFSKILFYGGVSLYGYMIMMKENWSGNVHEYYKTFGPSYYPFKISFYYLLEFSYYLTEIQYVIVHYFYKDRFEIIVHHFITLILISLSYYNDYTRIGVIVMALHDVSDPFLESAKLFIYMEKSLLANIAFVFFTIIFIISRLIFYPYFLLYPAFLYFLNDFNNPKEVICVICLVLLYFLHIYWTFLIFKTIKKILINKEVRDTRSESHLNTSK